MQKEENNFEEGFWVFISHSTKDFDRVRLVRNALENNGFRPILFYLKCMEDEEEINELIKKEIDARSRFILCDSPNAQASKYVQSEVNYIQSKKRMYEIVDLSQIEINSPEIDKDVLNLIKPFRRRTSVFISYNNMDRSLAKELESECLKYGFHAWDMDYYLDVSANVNWSFLARMSIESTLSNGYFICLLSSKLLTYTVKELEFAWEIDSSRVLPVIIDKIADERIPISIHNKNILNVCNIVSPKEKAKTIVETLISMDLDNQTLNNHEH